jgi:hypothetical protein
LPLDSKKRRIDATLAAAGGRQTPVRAFGSGSGSLTRYLRGISRAGCATQYRFKFHPLSLDVTPPRSNAGGDFFVYRQ